MTYALSTNWCCRRIASGEEIADLALALGFDELELGFHTTDEQVRGFKARLDKIRIGSVHAFCPVPLSAPQGYPELYQLASFEKEGRAMARVQIVRNIRFAAEVGADALVLHLGRVSTVGLLPRRDLARRIRRGRRMVDVAKRELDTIVPELETCGVTLGLENLPYLAGFPAEWEIGKLCGDWVKPWYDTGHQYVRETAGWLAKAPTADRPDPVGLHVNDSNGGDDHLPPGAGKIDFAALRDMARAARHRVFEPNEGVTSDDLRASLRRIKALWR